ncbi:hypothetical protein TNCT_229731 [Trichonephila clavata]|uniref:Uncharacterized protein n=1 Tax=Trichonephila clavata TaxID=2740835 RepID=A0A8X6FQB3_TRICU|nr:hypothetical protein TNCT_229731 [Trichonephila clavata]
MLKDLRTFDVYVGYCVHHLKDGRKKRLENVGEVEHLFNSSKVKLILPLRNEGGTKMKDLDTIYTRLVNKLTAWLRDYGRKDHSILILMATLVLPYQTPKKEKSLAEFQE